MKPFFVFLGLVLANPLFGQAHGKKLRQDCKRLGIGKYCGLRHQH